MDADRRDALEAEAFYELVEGSVKARFYGTLDANGVPRRWVEMVRHTLRTLGPQVLASRMLRDYVCDLYVPAAQAGRAVAASAYVGARELAQWRARVTAAWNGVRVSHVESVGAGYTPRLGSPLSLRALVELGGLAPGDVQVQAAYGRVDESDLLHDATLVPMTSVETAEGPQRYETTVPLERTGAFGYTVRVLPHHALLAGPAELGLVATA